MKSISKSIKKRAFRLPKYRRTVPLSSIPKQRAGQPSNSVMNTLSGFRVAKRYDIEAGFIRALFKGVREVWATAAPAQVTDVDLNDMHQAR